MNPLQEARIVSNELSNEATAAARACQNSSINLISSNSALNNITNTNIAAAAAAAAAASSSYTAASASGTQFNRNILGLSFGLKIHLSFGPRFPYTKKLFRNGLFRHVSGSKWNLSPFFNPKLKPKFSY